MIGKTIGQYQVIDKIGEGGMGVVYRAEDTKLKRTVALKFLPQDLTRSAEARERFIHEAQAASALDHPNICTIYEIDETDEGQVYIVMGLYEGQTLREKIAERPLKLEDAIDITSQIAQGLARAHEQKIIHRDIKPANIFITTEGQVKILDFGVAKLAGATKLTLTGTTLGTISYMAPEQARGDEADHKADIWSLGVLMYEMLTGQQPFKGEHEQAVIYSILNEEPEPITALRTGIPLDLEWIVQKALKKDPRQRYQHVDEIPVDLDAVEERRIRASRVSTVTHPSTESTAQVSTKRSVILSIPSFLAILAATGIVVFIISSFLVSNPLGRGIQLSPQSTKHFEEATRPIPVRGLVPGSNLAFSPDGSKLVFVGEERLQLYLREMDRPGALPIEGTENATVPFISPDGRLVGYFDPIRRLLMKVSLLGGPPERICNASSVRGASWSQTDTIYFTPNVSAGLYAVSANGGNPEVVTIPDLERGEKSHRFPEVLPGGEALLFTIGLRDISTWDFAEIAVLDLETRQIKILVRGGTNPKYSSSGHMIYARSGALWAVPFDPNNFETGNEPVKIVDGVVVSEVFGGGQYSLSHEGSLAYIAGDSDAPRGNLVWVDHHGLVENIGAPNRYYFAPAISPDGKMICVSIQKANDELWIYDIEREMLNLFASGGGDFIFPFWHPDGKSLVYVWNRTGRNQLFRSWFEETTEPEQILQGTYPQSRPCYSPDGRMLVFVQTHPETNADIWVIEFDSDQRPESFLATSDNERWPAVSPDGRWLAYASDETDMLNIYVQSFPEGGGKIPISVEGGTLPVWAPDGTELYFLSGRKMMAVDVSLEPTFRASKPRELFECPYFWNADWNVFDISPDGERFLMVESIKDESVNQVNIVLNWSEELKRLVPQGK